MANHHGGHWDRVGGAGGEMKIAPAFGDNFGNNRLGGESQPADPSIVYRILGVRAKPNVLSPIRAFQMLQIEAAG